MKRAPHTPAAEGGGTAGEELGPDPGPSGTPRARGGGHALTSGRLGALKRRLAQPVGPRRSGPPPGPAGPISSSLRARMVLALGVVGYVAFYLTWSFLDRARFASVVFDTAIHDQAAWLLSQGVSPFSTIMGRPYFGDHLYFLTLILVPFYWLGGGVKTAMTLQVLAFGLAAVPAFLVAREKLRSEWMACAVGWAYLLNPSVGWMTLDQFHPDSFEVPLIFLCVYFLMKKRWRTFLAMVVLLLLAKEDTVLLVVGLGVWAAIGYRRVLGAMVAVGAVVWAFVSFRLLLPFFSGAASLAVYVGAHGTRIAYGGVGEFARALVSRPGSVMRHAVALDRPLYYLKVLGPLVFLPLRTWVALALAGLPFAVNAFSQYEQQRDIRFHSGSLLIPALMVGAVWGVSYASPRVRRVLLVLVLVASVAGLWLWGPAPGSRDSAGWPEKPVYARAAGEAMALIPDGACVAADERFVTYLTHRIEVYEFPNPFGQLFWGDCQSTGQPLPDRMDRVAYVLVMKEQEYSPGRIALAEVLAGGAFETRYDKDGVLLLARPGSELATAPGAAETAR